MNLFKKKEKKVKEKKKKDSNEGKKRFTLFELIFFMIASCLFGMVLGCLVLFATTSFLGGDKYLNEFNTVYNYIKKNYYKKVSSKDLISGAISGMMNSLGDEHTIYMNKDMTDEFNMEVDGNYKGVGMTIQTNEDGTTTIISVYDDGPADKAGLKVDDVLLAIDGEDVTEKNADDIAGMVRNTDKTSVKIKIRRGEEEKTIKVKISDVSIETVAGKVIEKDDKKIGYIEMSVFSSNTYSQFKKELKKLEKKKIDSLVIDVRSNTGGELDQAHKILDLFFKKKTVLYQLETNGKKIKYYADTNDSRSYPVAILIDSYSASASEVLASCFRDNYKDVTLIGLKTYGKGTVQEAVSLSNGTSMKLTTQRWLTPKGKSIDGKGVKPDIEVDYDDSEEDVQLNRALEELSKK